VRFSWTLLALCFLISFSRCTQKRGSNAEELVVVPVPISGKGIATLSNVRNRCDFRSIEADVYEIKCQVTTLNSDGSETLAMGFAPGVSLLWSIPRKVEGMEIEVSGCQFGHLGFSQTCDVRLDAPQLTKVQISFEVRDSVVAQSRVETETLLLPYSIEANFGRPNQISSQFVVRPESERFEAAGNNSTNVRSLVNNEISPSLGEAKMGFQIPSFKPLELRLGDVSGGCFRGGRFFVATENHVWEVDEEGKQARLYAGSGSAANGNEFSHRLRVRLGGKSFAAPLAIACTSDGLLVADTRVNRILKMFDSGEVTLFAGNGSSTYSGDDGAAIEAGVPNPVSIAVGPDGSVYVVGESTYKIRKIDSKGIISRFAGTGVQGGAGDGGLALNAELNHPMGLTVGPDGAVYFCDRDEAVVRRVDLTGVIYRVAGVGRTQEDVSVFLGDGGPAVAAQLFGPASLAFDSNGNLLIGDIFSSTVRRVNTLGIIQAIIGTNEGGRYVEGSAALGSHVQANAMAFSPKGELHIFGGQQVRILRQDKLFTAAGLLNPRDVPDGVSATDVEIRTPKAFALAPDGTIYFTGYSMTTSYTELRTIRPDGIVNTVLRRTLPSNTTTQVNFTGDRLAAGPDGAVYVAEHTRILKFKNNELSSVAAYSGVYGTQQMMVDAMAVSPDGVLHVVDKQNPHSISVITPERTMLRIIGNGGWVGGFAGDGQPLNQAQFNSPRALAFDREGAMYIADAGNFRIRKIKNGIVSTIAGNGQGGRNVDDVVATEVAIEAPYGIAVDGNGYVYFIEAPSRNRIRVLEPLTDGSYRISTLVGTGGAKDCGSGVAQGRASEIDLDSKIRAALSVTCIGQIEHVGAIGNCELPNGKTTIVFGQTFTDDPVASSGHMVRISRACVNSNP